MSDSRDERMAGNEVIFRTVNENIAALADSLDRTSEYEFVCECADVECFERIALTLAEYQRVRVEGAWFVLKPGHEQTDIESVLQTHDEYLVVEKNGVAGEIAEAKNPRG